MNTLAQAIKMKREERDISAASLSREAGFSPSYVAKIEAGMTPTIVGFAKLAKVLEFTNEEIVYTIRRAGEESDR